MSVGISAVGPGAMAAAPLMPTMLPAMAVPPTGLPPVGLAGPLGVANSSVLSAISGTRLAELARLLVDFSTSEILLALLLSSQSSHRCRPGCRSTRPDEALWALLLAAAYARQLQAALPTPAPFAAQAYQVSGAAAVSAGMSLNVMA